MPSDEFKNKFDGLMDEMSKLLKDTPDDKIRDLIVDMSKLSQDDPTESKSISQYKDRFLESISGQKDQFAFILKNHQEMSDDEITAYENQAVAQNMYFVLPSLVKPTSTVEGSDFVPYLLFFSHSKKLYMIPRYGFDFNDDISEEFVEDEYDYED